MANKTVADTFSDFRQKALRRKHNYETACAQNGELKEIRQKINGAAMQKMRCALEGKPEEQYDILLSSLSKKEKELTDGLGLKKYNCDYCGDTGLANGKNCNCLLEQIYLQCYGAVDISKSPIDFDSFDEEVFDNNTVLPSGKTQRQRIVQFRKWITGFIDEYPDTKRSNILITGKSGLGKSFLMYCAAKYAKEKNIDVMLIRANELFSLFFAHRMGEEIDFSYLYNAGLLMIDDIGTEPITQNVSNEYFYELIAKRLERKKHSIFATNVDDLQKRYDDRISSRLNSKNDTLCMYFEGQDLRA